MTETEAILERGNANLTRMGMGEAQQAPGEPAARNSAMRPDDAFRAAQDGKPKRAPAVKGVCARCGKNYSRHISAANGARLCFRDSGGVFTLEPVATEQPAQGAGGLTQADADELRNLAIKMQVTDGLAKEAAENYERACQQWNAFLDSLVKGGKP